MKKINLALSAILFASAISAHELWIVNKDEHKISADLVYGHDFPTAEKIPEKRLSLFDTPYAVNSKSKRIKLVQKGENYHYEGQKIGNDSYTLVANYKPTYWIKKSDGKWEMNKTRQDFPDAQICENSSFQAKYMIIGKENEKSLTNPLNSGLEITPVSLPSQIGIGKISKFRLTRDGKPLEDKEVLGGFAGYIDHADAKHGGNEEMRAFYNKTDKNGEFVFKPTTKGLWFLVVELEEDSNNPKCEKNWSQTTLTFDVK